MATAEEILQASKGILEIPLATGIQPTDLMVFFNFNTQQMESIPVSVLTGLNNWIFIEDSWVDKDTAGGNVNISVLEIGDQVYYKKITNGTVPLTINGMTYIGGDKQLATSYRQDQTITQ